MELDTKHKSRLHKGLNKMVARQDAKPEFAYIQIIPIIMSFDEDDMKYKPLRRIAWNNKWNGMNLKQVRNRLQPTMPNWFNSYRRVNEDGKYSLSYKGKQHLNRKKAKNLVVT
jgi:hypothetical protein